PDVLPQRRRAVSVRADGGSGRVRDARFLRALAYAGADDGEVPAEAACAGARGRGGGILRPDPAWARQRLPAPARGLQQHARAVPGEPTAVRWPVSRRLRRFVRPAAVGGTGFLPGSGQWTVQAAPAGADRNADRADRGDRRSSGP